MSLQKPTNNNLNLFSRHYRKKYGKAVGKIALSTWQACPNRSQNGGCIYCSAAGYTPYYLCKDDSIATQLRKGKEHLVSHKFHYYFAYFQQETTTALPLPELKKIIIDAVSGAECIGIIISTRPDYLDRCLLDFLAALPEIIGKKLEILLELGLQSSHDSTLSLLNRNHTFKDYRTANALIKHYPEIDQGVHLILGLPAESHEHMLQTVQQVCALGVEAIKLHHLQILKNTKLLTMYQEVPFPLYQAEDYLELLAELIAYIPATTVVHRLWSSTALSLLVAPRWQVPQKELGGLLSKIMHKKNLFQGKHTSLAQKNQPQFPTNE